MCFLDYLCLHVFLSVSQCVCSRVNSIWFVVWVCSLQFYFLTLSKAQSVCVFRVSCQVIILSVSKACTDMNKRERNEWQTLSLSLWGNHGNMAALQVGNWLPLCLWADQCHRVSNRNSFQKYRGQKKKKTEVLYICFQKSDRTIKGLNRQIHLGPKPSIQTPKKKKKET